MKISKYNSQNEIFTIWTEGRKAGPQLKLGQRPQSSRMNERINKEHPREHWHEVECSRKYRPSQIIITIRNEHHFIVYQQNVGYVRISIN